MSKDNPIDVLLKAEQQAETDIQRAKDDARATINQALETARAIRSRADKRIADLHARSAAKVEAQCQTMWTDHQMETTPTIERFAHGKTVEDIARRLACELTGGGRADGSSLCDD